MPLTLKESHAVAALADALYEFLPANPHPMADPSISFPGVARKLGIQVYWPGGSKRPAVIHFLTLTLEQKRGLFCRLILEIVNVSLAYRRKKNPVSRREIQTINQSMLAIGFKIPELYDPEFLNLLRADDESLTAAPVKKAEKVSIAHLSGKFLDMSKLPAQERGFEFEKFLAELFAAFDLAPRSSFRLLGEQIDGSLQLDTQTYLVEAKWVQSPVGQAELLTFQSKVEAKSKWSRGLFISYSGFSPDGLTAFARGRSTNLISLTGEDIHFVLDGRIQLPDLLRKKARKTAETGEFHVRAYDLLDL